MIREWVNAPRENRELRTRLAGVRKQRARLRKRLERCTAALERARRELDGMREFTLEVFPHVAMPDEVCRVLAGVREERLTHLTEPQLTSLVSCVLEAEVSGREGLVIEAGTALGGSAIAMAAAKSPERPMLVYDVFGVIPPPGEEDGAAGQERYAEIAAGRSPGLEGDVYYGYREDLLGEVTASFARHGVPVDENRVELVQGLFQDTIRVDEPVALAHVDADWYESTLTCLTRIAPHLVPGGRIVIDDYWFWSGCRTAVEEYVADHPELRVERRAKIHLVRR
ncbi:MAG: TylF/MycF/NovP-related O-methyltransferase [Gaiellaceae bacterium]